MQPEEIVTALKSVNVFEQIEDSHLEWMAERGQIAQLQEGDYLFRRGDPVEHMHVLLQGKLQLKAQQGNQLKDFQIIEQGQITGVLPYSRMREAVGFGVAVEPTTVFSLHKKYFQEMEQRSHKLVQALVAVMTTRARDYTRRQQQNDKMMALGKLSAGLAHELNNPAAAIIRSASALKKHLRHTPENFKEIISARLDSKQVDEVNDILFGRLNQPPNQPKSILQRSQQEDEIADWLEDMGMEDGFDIAETMVDFGFDVSDLEEINEITKGQYLGVVIRWLHNVLTTEKMVSEIEDASTRISELVQSVKTYTHMDRAADQELLEVHQGLDSTLTMLGHKLKQKNIRVKKMYDNNLPKIKGFVGELNQVWTNLIDNAIDAMDRDGQLTVQTDRQKEGVEIKIIDNGSGIPPEMQSLVFDPFFTTKEVGKGTGMGLDIVKKILDQHRAEIQLYSQPGETIFSIRFPVE